MARADGRAERKRTINGKVVHFYGKTAADAERNMIAYMQNAKAEQSSGIEFSKVANAFWADKESTLKYGSVRGYKHRVELAVEWFGDTRIRLITAAQINAKLQGMAMDGKAYKTISNQKSVLDLIWQYWCARMDGDANPVSLLKIPKGLPQKKRKPPTEKEVDIIRANPAGFGLLPNLLMYTGLRVGEALALQKKDIDGDTIHVTKECVWHSNQPVLEPPKTENAVRNVPILEPLKPILLPCIAKLRPNDYVFGGGKMLTKSAYTNAWLQYCKAHGIAYQSDVQYRTGRTDSKGRQLYKAVWQPTLTAHQLRHEFASVLVECNISESVAKELLGHADIITTHRWYVAVKSRQMESATNALNAHYNAMAGK